MAEQVAAGGTNQPLTLRGGRWITSNPVDEVRKIKAHESLPGILASEHAAVGGLSTGGRLRPGLDLSGRELCGCCSPVPITHRQLSVSQFPPWSFSSLIISLVGGLELVLVVVLVLDLLAFAAKRECGPP